MMRLFYAAFLSLPALTWAADAKPVIDLTVTCEVAQQSNWLLRKAYGTELPANLFQSAVIKVEAGLFVEGVPENLVHRFVVGKRRLQVYSNGGRILVGAYEATETNPFKSVFSADYLNQDGAKVNGGFTGFVQIGNDVNEPGSSEKMIAFDCYKN
jgi:hypothetical protein